VLHGAASSAPPRVMIGVNQFHVGWLLPGRQVRNPVRISVSRRLASRPIDCTSSSSSSQRAVLQSAARDALRLAVIGAGVFWLRGFL